MTGLHDVRARTLAARAALGLRRRLLALADAVVPPQLALFERGMGVAQTQLLRAAVRLGVADRLKEGPRSAGDLARACGVSEDALFRALRALAALGVFELGADGRFANNRLSLALCADALGSVADFLVYLGSRANALAWGDLERTLADGASAFERVHGESVWAWVRRHPEEERAFAAAMVHITELDAPEIAAGYPFGELRRVCDVAGGHGTLLAEVLRRHRELEGVLLDAPQVVAEAPGFLAARGVAGRTRCVGGDFFEEVPADCDAYLLKDVLHDWDDEACLRILRTCRRAARTGARVVVAELLLERLDASSPAAVSDVHMMVVCHGGRQRSAAEHQALLAAAGFRAGRVLHLRAPLGLVEGIAA
ncbi:MAG: methyltransferase [Anaeromyxobacteraceae bacterium]